MSTLTTTTTTASAGRLRGLRALLMVIGAVQLVLGTAFLIVPGATERLLGLSPSAPTWANWLLAMMAARCLGYGVGMFVAAQAPHRHRAWIYTMVGVQAIDWIATMAYLIPGDLGLSQVGTAAFLPVLFILGVLYWRPRRDHA
jgi:hypothetical protein